MLQCRLAVALVFLLAPSEGRAQDSRKPIKIEIVANDYAFLALPTRVAAGSTEFTFQNQGKVNHEVAIAHLDAGTSIEEVVKVSKAGGRIRDVAPRMVGILIAGPGKKPEGRLLVDLVRGETYLVFCNFRDTPEAPPHMTLGMYTTFKAQ